LACWEIVVAAATFPDPEMGLSILQDLKRHLLGSKKVFSQEAFFGRQIKLFSYHRISI
jgi:hypothetical protein